MRNGLNVSARLSIELVSIISTLILLCLKDYRVVYTYGLGQTTLNQCLVLYLDNIVAYLFSVNKRDLGLVRYQ